MAADNFVIQPMTVADLPQVLAIEQASFPQPFSENFFRMELELDVARLYVVRDSERVVGYIDYWNVGPEMHVITLAADPAMRKKGIASRLLDFMIQDAKKNPVSLISLDVRESNLAAIALYEKFGFEKMRIRKKYYQDNQEDAVVMDLVIRHE